MPLDSMLHATQLNMHARPNGPAHYYVTHARLSHWHARPWHASAHLACSCHGDFPVPLGKVMGQAAGYGSTNFEPSSCWQPSDSQIEPNIP